MSWLVSLLSSLVVKLASWALTWALAEYHQVKDDQDSSKVIDAKLKAFKDAYKKAFDGNPVTKEQKDALNKAISDFIRNDDTGGV